MGGKEEKKGRRERGREGGRLGVQEGKMEVEGKKTMSKIQHGNGNPFYLTSLFDFEYIEFSH